MADIRAVPHCAIRDRSSSKKSMLILSKKSLYETWPTIAQHGPFVVNTRQELKQAVDDFNRRGLA